MDGLKKGKGSLSIEFEEGREKMKIPTNIIKYK